MSRSASIDIHGSAAAGLTPGRLVAALLEAGWTYNDHGEITFLPLGEGDLSSWQSGPLREWPAIFRALDEKAQNKEVAGIVLLTAEASPGGIFLMEPDLRTLNFIASVHRRALPGAFGATDYSWYLERILPALEGLGYQVERIECSEIA